MVAVEGEPYIWFANQRKGKGKEEKEKCRRKGEGGRGLSEGENEIFFRMRASLTKKLEREVILLCGLKLCNDRIYLFI